MLRSFGAFLSVLSLAAGTAGAAEETSPVGRQVENFSLRDYRGKVHELKDFAESQLVVIAFVGCECPLAKLYAPRLAQLADEFGPRGAAFLAIDANSQDSLAELAAYAQTHKISFPVLKDAGNAVADQMGAVRTPEVFVLDRERTIRYWGRIDDQYIIGRQRPAPTREDLRLALEDLLAGKAPSVAETAAIGCHIGRVPKQSPSGDVTYSNQIARLLQKRCVECHRPGEIAPFPLTSYEEVVGWGETIREVVHEGRMPPWFANPEHGQFANDARLSDAEKQLIDDWLDGGSPEGNPADLPAPPNFTVGWQIPQPDQIFYIQDEAFDVPAEGVVKYQYFKVDPGFKEDRWIKAAEARPDNRSVVHHIVAFFVPPGAKLGGAQRGAMIGYAPGMPPTRFPEGAAMLVPAGSQIYFQLHYTPNGSPQKDRSSIGLIYADPAEVKHKIGGGMAPNRFFEIPPGDDNYEVRSKYRFDNDALLLNLTPHMHLRGKAFRYEAEYPDGRREILLDIPRYDFNWQLRYQLAVPKVLPKGTTLHCTAHYDNSAGNLANPDPTKPVRWGDQTWEEMMIGYFSTLPVPEPAPNAAP